MCSFTRDVARDILTFVAEDVYLTYEVFALVKCVNVAGKDRGVVVNVLIEEPVPLKSLGKVKINFSRSL